MRLIILSISFFYLIFNSTAKTLEEKDHFNVSLDFEARTSILVSKMTLEEKISQLGNNAPAIPRLGVLEYLSLIHI